MNIGPDERLEHFAFQLAFILIVANLVRLPLFAAVRIHFLHVVDFEVFDGFSLGVTDAGGFVGEAPDGDHLSNRVDLTERFEVYGDVGGLVLRVAVVEGDFAFGTSDGHVETHELHVELANFVALLAPSGFFHR